MNADSRDRLWLAVALLAIKGALLLAFGPADMPDTGGYVAYADQILAGNLGDARLHSGMAPITLFRVIGYPALVAAVMRISAQHWQWLMVIVQIVLSVAASLGLHVLARRFGLGRGLAALVVVAAATSLSLVLDQAVLTDSLFSTLMLACVILLTLPLLAGHPVRLGGALLAGLLFAAAFLLREATFFLSVGMAPLLALAAFGGARPSWRGLGNVVAVGIVFLLPLLVVQQGYREWNRVRVGVPVITTGAQTTMFQGLADAARIDPSVLDGEDVIHRTARQELRSYEFGEVLHMLDILFREHRMTAIDQMQAGFSAYFSAWRTHPGTMARMVLGHLRSNQAQLTVRPVDSLRELILWTQHDDGGFARWRSVREGRWWMAPVVVIDGLCKAVSVVIFAAFTLLTPWRLLRGDGITPANAAAAGLWLLYFALLGIYALVHLETRYVAAVVPLSLLVGVANLDWAWRQWMCRRRALSNDI